MSIIHDFVNWQYGDADNFGCLLFHLIAKADPMNRARIRAAFPWHVRLFDAWQKSNMPMTTKDMIDLARKTIPIGAENFDLL